MLNDCHPDLEQVEHLLLLYLGHRLQAFVRLEVEFLPKEEAKKVAAAE